MKFSINWLKRHLDTNKSISEIATVLTSIGIEVESVVDCDKIFQNFTIAKATNVQRHPNADRLRIFDALLKNGEIKHVVCGASNLREGLNVVLALPGAIIPSSGEKLKLSKIRGVQSEGMCCSFEELSLESSSDGIIELPDTIPTDAKIGDLLGLGDGIIDVSITPNRGDCFSIEGIARDLAAAGTGTLIEEETQRIKEEFDCDMNISSDEIIRDEFISDNMPYCAFRAIRGLNNKNGIEEINSLLKSAGINSNSAIVDIANFLTYDKCRPFHIYDLDKINGKIELRRANHEEKFVDLKGVEHSLNSDILVASDEKEILCVLGIIGGQSCACDENTTNILIESAIFDPVYISNIGNKMNISSDSRTRFERGINNEYALDGLNLITSMIQKYCGGKASKAHIIENKKFIRKRIEFTSSKLDKLTGIKIPFNIALEILEKLEIKVIEKTAETAICEIPPFRADLNIEEDLIEEVIRIFGYDKICCQMLPEQRIKLDKHILNQNEKISATKRLMCMGGSSELVSFSFIDGNDAKLFSSELIPTSIMNVVLANPISKDLSIMRNSLYPNLLKNVKIQFNKSQKYASLFEFGPVFFSPNGQRNVLCEIKSGKALERNWIEPQRDYDVFDIKSNILAVMKFYNTDLDKLIFDTTIVPDWYHPTRSSAIVINRKVVGYFGELHPNIISTYDIKNRCVGFELFIDDIMNQNAVSADLTQKKFFQPVDRDFSFILNIDSNSFQAWKLLSEIKKCSKLIKNAGIFDYYKNKDDLVALGVSITLQPTIATLTESEIKDISAKIIDTAKKLGCELRQ